MVSSHYFAPGYQPESPFPLSFGSRPSGNDAPAMPWLLETLLQNLDFDLEQVADVIDPILTAQNYCQGDGRYVQGVVVGDRCFLTSNLAPHRMIQATVCGTRWLMGQSSQCSLSVQAEGIDAYHVALGFDPQRGFFLTALGSESCTWVNGQPLVPLRAHALHEGDRVQIGSLRFEFLQEFCPMYPWNSTSHRPTGADHSLV